MKEELDIKTLLLRFMDGQTTLDEEAALGKYFRENDVPEEWLAYKEMFAYFDEGMPEEPAGKTSDEEKPATTPIYNIRRGKRRRLLAVAAAVAAMLVVAGTALFNSRQGNDDTAGQIAMTTGKTGEAPDSGTAKRALPPATPQQAAADSTDNNQKEDGQKPHRLRKSDIHVPHPERLLAASHGMNDSLNRVARLLAEEKLREIEEEQQDLLNGIALYNAALQIDMYTAYDTDSDSYPEDEETQEEVY